MEPHMGEMGFRARRGKELWHFGTVGTGNKVIGWKVPRNASFVWMTCFGGGGGGGAGFTAASSVAKSGGNGGGAAGMARLWVPAGLLPGELYLWAGNGGRGGQASGNAGVGGTHSFITDVTSTTPVTSGVMNVILCSGTNVAGGGAAGTTGGGGAGGVAETVAAANGALIGPTVALGMFQAHAGPQAGGISSISSGGAGITWGNGGGSPPSPCSAGAAGGAVTAGNTLLTAGSVFAIPNGSNVISTSTGLPGVAAGPGGDGISGILQISPRTSLTQMMFLGGAGGGATSTGGTGGRGGNGSYGSGGGGGGAGITGGPGGDGGPGFIYICWI